MTAGRPTDYTPKIAAESCAVSYIYALSDPRTREVRYVGKTDCPKQRTWAHRSVQCGNSHRQKWIISLRRLELSPVFEVLQVVDQNDWPGAERHWIKQYKAIGCRLVNHDDGGIGATSGGKQKRLHYLKRELINTYNMLKRHSPDAAERLAVKMRALYLAVEGCPESWKRIGLSV